MKIKRVKFTQERKNAESCKRLAISNKREIFFLGIFEKNESEKLNY